jgi:hypothetical protein
VFAVFASRLLRRVSLVAGRVGLLLPGCGVRCGSDVVICLFFFQRRQCQRNHWKVHKPQCKQFNRVAVLVKIDDGNNYGAMSMSGGSNAAWVDSDWNGNPPNGKTLGDEFIVKIQYTPGLPLLVYDKTRSLNMNCSIDDGRSTHVDQVVAMIIEHGVFGRKGYFRARVQQNGKLEVFFNKMTGAQKW